MHNISLKNHLLYIEVKDFSLVYLTDYLYVTIFMLNYLVKGEMDINRNSNVVIVGVICYVFQHNTFVLFYFCFISWKKICTQLFVFFQFLFKYFQK